MTFRCSRCKQVKGVRSFSKDASRPDNRFPWCKTCQVEADNGRKFQDAEARLNGHTCPMDDVPIRGNGNRRFCSNKCKARAGTLKKKYNLTPAEYRTLIPEDKRCPICLTRPRLWNVDHNHKTGAITGAVCTNCNVGALATTFHDLEFVRRLTDFLQNTPAERLGITATANPNYRQGAKLHTRWRFSSK